MRVPREKSYFHEDKGSRSTCVITATSQSIKTRTNGSHRQVKNIIGSDERVMSSLAIAPPLSLRRQRTSRFSKIPHQVYRQLPVLPSIRSCKRPHDLLVMVHYLALFPRQARLALLAIEHLRLRGAIPKMLDLPPFMGRTVNSTRGRGLNAMLS